jgi:hypothetical protein
MRLLLIGTVLIAISSPAAAQQGGNRYDPDRHHAVVELREDFAVLKSSLEEGHGGLYRYSPKATIDRMFDDAVSRLDHPMTDLEFLALLSGTIAAINDGHSACILPGSAQAWFTTAPLHVPFGLTFVEGEAHISRNYTDRDDVPLGARVISINGQPMREIVERMFAILPSDGRVETSKYRALESDRWLSSAYNALFGPTTSYDVRYLATDGTAGTVVADGISSSTLRQRAARYPEPHHPPIALAYRRGVPVLTIRTFGSGAYRSASIDYPRFLQRTFQELADSAARALVIDLRDNGGGTDAFGKFLAAHLLPDDFHYYRWLEVNRDSFALFQFTSQPDRTYPRERLRPNDRGRFDTLGHPNLGLQHPREPVFDGAVYVLINGRSFSATGEVTSILHHYRRATFIGEEGGAGYYGNTSGSIVTIRLPNTGMRCRIPLVRYTMAVDGYTPTDRGLIPDHEVTPTVEDVLAGRDAVLEYAVALANEHR